jgi:hypothetical protein
MKKIYLLAAAVGMAGVASAQMAATSFQRINENREVKTTLVSAERAAGDILFQDDFQTTTNWTVTNDGLQGDWASVTPDPQNMIDYMGGGMTSATAANGYYFFDGVQFLLAGSVDPQDSKLEMNLGADCSAPGITSISLQFDQRYRAFNTDETWVEVSIDGGATWPNMYQVNADAEGNGATLQTTEFINIVGAGEADVRVRFRWICTSDDDGFGSGYGWAVDDVKIIETWDNDHKMVNAYPTMGAQMLDYYQIPTSQIAPITFTGEVCNNGAAAQNGSKFNANVTGMETFTTASTPGILAVAACDSVSGLAPFTPVAGAGDYDVAMYFDAIETEQVTAGDTLYGTITVTDDVYSRDNGIIGGRISNVSSQPGLSMKIGNIMDINADMTVGYVQVGISDQSGTAVGQLINVEIQKYNAGTDAYEFLEVSADYTILAGDEGTLVEIPLNNNVDLVAGDDILVMAGHYGGTDEVAFMYAQTTFEGSVIGYTDDGSSFSLLEPGAIIVRLVEKDLVDQSIDENGVVASTSVYPNPANDVATVNFTLNEVANVSIEVVDYTGKVISTENLGSVANGAHTVNTSNVAEGIYFVNLVVNGNVTTNKLVVSKK